MFRRRFGADEVGIVLLNGNLLRDLGVKWVAICLDVQTGEAECSAIVGEGPMEREVDFGLAVEQVEAIDSEATFLVTTPRDAGPVILCRPATD